MRLRINKKNVEINDSVFYKDKLVKYLDLVLKPIGYYPNANAWFYAGYINEDKIRRHIRYTHDEFYELCKKQGCKITDIFLVVYSTDKTQIGRYYLPTMKGYFDITFLDDEDIICIDLEDTTQEDSVGRIVYDYEIKNLPFYGKLSDEEIIKRIIDENQFGLY